jgi:hypothetical protein
MYMKILRVKMCWTQKKRKRGGGVSTHVHLRFFMYKLELLFLIHLKSKILCYS